MNRRSFIAAGAALLAHPAIAHTSKLVSIRDAYTLWYNRPSAITLPDGFAFGFITSSGGIEVANVDERLRLRERHRLFSFNRASDHGAPALLRIPAGPYQGHVLACFSNHASELFMTRTAGANDISTWGPVKSVDEGRCTYASLGATPEGAVVLMYTKQHSYGKYERGQWRETLYMMSRDGGDTWSPPIGLIRFGPGTFPYSTPMSLSANGKLATSYALYTYDQQRHMGLALAIADIDTGTVESKTIVSTNDRDELIPYETKWKGETIYMTFSRLSSGRATACIAKTNVGVSPIEQSNIGPVAICGYASGAALSPDCHSIFFSPPSGGLMQRMLKTGRTRSILGRGRYSMPFTLSQPGKTVVGVSKDQVVRSSISFGADLTILYV
ncbi:sialidase family protein [Achromobacter xylosoxidans]|uniref:hypothetical protein n=1 Tax=Alcaligenes xylosoxydans xylosoxydans TaxID=85698 RepID=UPI0038FC4761